MQTGFIVKRNKRARVVRISVAPGGRVTVSAPRHVSARTIAGFVAEKQAWIEQAQAKMRTVTPKALTGPQQEYEAHKAAARVVCEKLLKELQEQLGVRYKTLQIRNQKTRWGSCSSTGTLSIHYRIVFLPPHLQKYLLVHELCHIRFMNHSPAFWRAVAQVVPDYIELRKQLRMWSNKL